LTGAAEEKTIRKAKTKTRKKKRREEVKSRPGQLKKYRGFVFVSCSLKVKFKKAEKS
jgi:hypothetical protein